MPLLKETGAPSYPCLFPLGPWSAVTDVPHKVLWEEHTSAMERGSSRGAEVLGLWDGMLPAKAGGPLGGKEQAG